MDTFAKSKDQKTKARIKATKAARKVPTEILLKKKAECDAKALKIVEKMIEEQVEIDWMLQNLGSLNRNHMEDIVEERAILRLCGYVLCKNPLTKVVNKRYQISTLRNKVYDIEKTKNFCSHRCYLSADYLMEQMLTSPLWLRGEEEIPEFKILQKVKSRSHSPPGVEIKLTPIDLPDDDSDTVVENSEEKPDIKAEISQQLKKMPVKSSIKSSPKEKRRKKNEEELEKNSSEENNVDSTEKITKIVSFGENEVREFVTPKIEVDDDSFSESEDEQDDSWIEFMECDDEVTNTENEVTSEKQINPNESIAKNSPTTHNNKRESETTTRDTKTHQKTKKTKTSQVSFETLVLKVEKSFSEWVTPDTSAFLHGEQSSKQQIFENIAREEKYNIICKKLYALELEKKKQEREENSSESLNLQPHPNFSDLQEEAKNLELKVKAFYEGKTEVAKSEVDKKEETEKIQENNAVVPLTDSHDSKALRRRIFLNKLNKVLPDLLRTLAGPGLHQYEYTRDRTSMVKALISTFRLTATNIVFKTAEWTLIALLIIKMLAVLDPEIKKLFDTKQALTYTTMILMTYKLNPNYLDVLITSLTAPSLNENLIINQLAI